MQEGEKRTVKERLEIQRHSMAADSGGEVCVVGLSIPGLGAREILC